MRLRTNICGQRGCSTANQVYVDYMLNKELAPLDAPREQLVRRDQLRDPLWGHIVCGSCTAHGGHQCLQVLLLSGPSQDAINGQPSAGTIFAS